MNLFEYSREICTLTIHFVDENQARHFVLVGLTPNGFGLWFYTRGPAEYDNGTVQHPQATLNFNGEIHVSGCIDDVDAMFIVLLIATNPKAGGRCGSNRYAAFLLLLHPVHHGCAVMHFAYLVRYAGVEEYALGSRCLARIHMGYDAYIAIAMYRRGAGHKTYCCLE